MSRARELAELSNVINKGANLQPNLLIQIWLLLKELQVLVLFLLVTIL